MGMQNCIETDPAELGVEVYSGADEVTAEG